jgi:hypothetical protein
MSVLALGKLINDSLLDFKRHILSTLFKSNFIMIIWCNIFVNQKDFLKILLNLQMEYP